jgi:hypothetical protein
MRSTLISGQSPVRKASMPWGSRPGLSTGGPRSRRRCRRGRGEGARPAGLRCRRPCRRDRRSLGPHVLWLSNAIISVIYNFCETVGPTVSRGDSKPFVEYSSNIILFPLLYKNLVPPKPV